jgi:hypothetical protein
VTLVSWLRNFRLRSAARRYAARLPDYLRRAHGRSEHYSAPQVAHAVRSLRLPDEYLWLAYAAYLPEAEYEHSLNGLHPDLTYSEAGAEFARHVPSRPWSAEWNPDHRIGGYY